MKFSQFFKIQPLQGLKGVNMEKINRLMTCQEHWTDLTEIWHTESYYDVGIRYEKTFGNSAPNREKKGLEECSKKQSIKQYKI